MKLINHIDVIMYQNDMTMKSLEDQAKIGHNTLNRIKNHNNCPNVVTAFKLSKALNTSVESLFEVIE